MALCDQAILVGHEKRKNVMVIFSQVILLMYACGQGSLANRSPFQGCPMISSGRICQSLPLSSYVPVHKRQLGVSLMAGDSYLSNRGQSLYILVKSHSMCGSYLFALFYIKGIEELCIGCSLGLYSILQ